MAAAVLAASLAVTGCSSTPAAPAAPEAGADAGDTLSGTVTVFAAASLTESFADLADAFSAEHPNVTVTLSFGGSSGLATQLVEGAPADIFASASPATMTTVIDAGLVDDASIFASTVLDLVVPAGNPGSVSGLADLARPELVVALCAVEVPCGAAAATVLEAAGIVASVDTFEQDVRAVLTKVELGEVDAALVYRTDVLAAGGAVEGIELPEAAYGVVSYPIAALAAAPNPTVADAFIAFVLSDAGQKILREAGFGAP